jgi:hypothetical protein
MGNFDHYSVAQQIAQKLHDEGKPEWAAKIDDAVAAGSTGSEIFMALRWHLRDIQGKAQDISAATRDLIDDLLRQLDKHLQ